jgi:hypothetical protein
MLLVTEIRCSVFILPHRLVRHWQSHQPDSIYCQLVAPNVRRWQNHHPDSIYIRPCFLLFFPCNHIIHLKKTFFFFRRSNRQRNFSLLFLLHKASHKGGAEVWADGWAEREGKGGVRVYEAYEVENKRGKLRCLLLRRKKIFFYNL